MRTEKKEEQWNTWDQSRHDTYEQEQNIGQATTYHKPKPTKTATTFGGEGVMSCDKTTPEGFVRMPYGRRMLMPMPLLGSAGVPVFDGQDVTVFLEQFEELCEEYGIMDEQKVMKLLKYCEWEVGEVIKMLKEWEMKDYCALVKAVLNEYKEYDSYQRKFSIQFLKAFKSKLHNNEDNLLHYCQTYHTVAKELIAKNVLSKYIAGVWFLHGLLPTIAATVMWKHRIDTEDPSMVDYDAIQEFMVKATTAEKAIQWMNGEWVTNLSRQHEIKELADHVHAGVAIPKEKEANETMRAPATVPAVMTKSDRMIEELTKSFGQLNMNIGVLVQWIISQSQAGNGVMHPQAWVYQTSGVSRATQGGGEGGLPEVNGVGAGEMNTYGGRNQGMCWYCLNCDPGMQPHCTQNACPLFLHHVAMGTVHLNENGKVALG